MEVVTRPKDTCSPIQRAALDLQLRRLRYMEDTSAVYQEMCAAANFTVANRVLSAQARAAQQARRAAKALQDEADALKGAT